MPKIHPSAIVHPEAELADDVEVGAYALVEADVTIGPGCVLRPHAVVRRFTSLGCGNLVDSFAVLGGEPQDLKFEAKTRSFLRIGDGNVFREGVTISRATGEGNATVVGDRSYWMTAAHAGHNAVVHTVIGRRVVISAHVGVHQFCWVGDGVMSQGNAAIAMHVPPFVVVSGLDSVVGLNIVGLRRWPGFGEEDRRQVKEAFSLVYRAKLPLREALARMDEHREWGTAAGSFREFVRRVLDAKPPYVRGLTPQRRRARPESD
jgi:UDP-N-acetylglucosamine acyltransferase